MRPATVGVFDSGVGGLSVWRELVLELPYADLVYLADQAHCPYGARPKGQVRALAEQVTAFLVTCGADVVVVACNTASAAALHHLRAQFPVPIVGMEPAVKPAALRTQTGHVGVIATEVTFQGDLFASLLERFAQGVRVHTQVCPGLVEQVEAGAVDSDKTRSLLRRFLTPLLDAGIDSLVLGCTHYPFLRPAIRDIAGPSVAIIDPSGAVARQAGRMIARVRPDAVRDRQGTRTLYTTAQADAFRQTALRLLGDVGQVREARWGASVECCASAAPEPGEVARHSYTVTPIERP